MIDPRTLSELVNEIKANICEIKKLDFVASDDEFVEILADHKATENLILVTVLPDYAGGGAEDNGEITTMMQFFVLEKVDYKAMKNRDDYMAVFQRTLEAARKFLQAFFALMQERCYAEKLDYDFTIRPIPRKAQCNGYEIQIDSKAFSEIE